MMGAEPTKAPMTIGVDSRLESELIEQVLDEGNFMYLKKGVAQRDELFLFAMALGWMRGVSSEASEGRVVGLARTSSFSSRLIAAIDLVHFKQVGFSEPNDLRDHRAAYKIAESYANAGLHLLKGDIESNDDSETYANELIAEMNAMYERVVIGPAE